MGRDFLLQGRRYYGFHLHSSFREAGNPGFISTLLIRHDCITTKPPKSNRRSFDYAALMMTEDLFCNPIKQDQ
jgi:hypothetical protein